MDSAKIIYIEEANELLANLEIALLALEENAKEKTYIEQVFRIMHTLKGNSSMFGLATVTAFVHDLETIYDKIRLGEMQLTKDLLDCTLAALDHLKIIIHDSELQNPKNKNNHSLLINKITSHISAQNFSEKENTETVNNKNITSFYIYFEPEETIFDNGTNPLYLLSELAAMGKFKAVPHFKEISSIAEYKPTNNIVYWDLFLETNYSKKDVRDVFVFVESNSKIEIIEIPCVNLLSNSKFNNSVSLNLFQNKRINTNEINTLIKNAGINLDDANSFDSISFSEEQQQNKKQHNQKEKQNYSIRVSSEKLDELMNLVSELVTTQAGLSLYVDDNKIQELEKITENVVKLSRRLRDITFGMTLVPINNMFSRFQRMIRDLSNKLGKDVEFISEGGETELDKNIIETLTDPLMHILRNSIDHGIETIEERTKKGKNQKGKITLKAYYSGVFVYIQISDDGKGIDKEKIYHKALQKNLIKQDENLTEKELFDFVFYPGFSTAQQVTDVSGRGVGMDVVKRNITNLKGEIFINSKLNEGTTLTIKLPLTLSIIDGLLVDIENVKYIIPLSVVVKCYEVNNKDMINNFNQLLVLEGEQIPFINLREEFKYPILFDSKSQLIVINNNEKKVGVSVDNIVGEYQAVIKPLGKYYKNQDFISGATILGDGAIALVLDTNKIIELYIEKNKLTEKVM